MENWALEKDNDSAVGTVSSLVDQLFWKFPTLESLGLTNEDEGMSQAQEFGNIDAETNDMSDDSFHQEVDKLLRQNLAIQQACADIGPIAPQSEELPFSDASSTSSGQRARAEGQPSTSRKRPRSPSKTEINERPKIKLRLIPPEPERNIDQHQTPLAFTTNRPQLRLHVFNDRRFSIHDALWNAANKDPMKPDLDDKNLRRLTVATLRTLGVPISIEELPPVDLGEPSITDSQQVLPAAAMQVVTAMILGTSGDKDVSQTVGSQISNGDLVALQRMIVEGLRSKNIVIHTTISARKPSTSDDPADVQVNQMPHPDNIGQSAAANVIDISRVKYEPPTNVTRLFLRLYRFILNMLLATPDCWPFIQPVPATAFVYHQEIKHPMDLSTIEQNVWAGKYTAFAKFERDMQLIWNNAKTFHHNAGTIPKHANNLERLFYKVIFDLKKQIRKTHHHSSASHDFKFDTSSALPEESDFSYPPLDQLFSKQTKVYTISAISPLEAKAKERRGLTNEKDLYLQLNGPFFQSVERMKADPNGNHQIVPRFYIAKNRTLLRQARAQGILAIFYNTKASRSRSRTKQFQIQTDMILAYPVGELYDIDQMNVCTDESSPKGWIHLRPLRVMEGVSFDINETIDRDYFRRMFATAKIPITEEKNEKNGNYNEETRRLLRKIACCVLGLPEEEADIPVENSESRPKSIENRRPVCTTTEKTTTSETNRQPGVKVSQQNAVERSMTTYRTNDKSVVPKTATDFARLATPEMSHEVWKKLFKVCESKGVGVCKISEKYGRVNWAAPNSEGFFKQVYFLDEVVVQTFRQMTMYQRITEVACLMKLKNLPHMAQLREILYNENGDIAGLSMERYQTTLKQYAHVHSHHRLTAYQKYNIIYQMLVCMKTIHNAGLAHRDLSEVNMMVNKIDGQLEDGSSKICLYLIDFGKAVFCEAQDVREWFVDVPRASWEYDGDVVPETKEELEEWCKLLPWVKGKPDHGYRMYRSIQTLPKTRSDSQVLPWLIHPQAEDIYSIGVMIWKVFAETEPWRGILDTDLQGLRYVAEDDYRIQRALEREVHGELSRQLLLRCLKTRPQDRCTASEILDWLGQDEIRNGLIGEWKMYSSETRATRKAKSMYGFEDTEEEERRRRKARKGQSGASGRGRGRPRAKPITPSEGNNHTAPVT
ncbi:Histone acetyltransferase kat2b [Apophysomyces ossiformis]|uniref:Histone acetyltransferase kat2b n=1 Tax=Apophysomyces ossiformis TaxID=679940 RepID=A0A8H7ETH9_9FUNG|nr:Histone acetyltransferase kat2b [Apophysomyces ossiformis]